MIYTDFVELYSLMLQAKFQNHSSSGSEEEYNGFTFYSHGGHLGYLTWTNHSYINFHSPFLMMLHLMFYFDWPRGFREDV